ncbi:hypothetical protein [Microbacterium tumbae]
MAWQSHTTLALADAMVNGRDASDRALAAARRGIELAPDIAYTHHVLGHVHLLIGRYRAAEHALRVALSMAPNDPYTLQLLGLTLERRGRTAAAMSLFAGLAGSEPSNGLHLQNLLAVLRKWILIFVGATLVWTVLLGFWAAVAVFAYPDDVPSRVAYFVVVLLIPLAASTAALLFMVRFRGDLRALVTVMLADAPLYAVVAVLLGVGYVLLLAGSFLDGAFFGPVMLAVAAVFISVIVITLVALLKGAPPLPPPSDHDLIEKSVGLVESDAWWRLGARRPNADALWGKPSKGPF